MKRVRCIVAAMLLLAASLTGCRVEFTEPTSETPPETSASSSTVRGEIPVSDERRQIANGVDASAERRETIVVNEEEIEVGLFSFQCDLGFTMEYTYETFRCEWDAESASAVLTSDLTDEDGTPQGVLTVSRGGQTEEETIAAVKERAGEAAVKTEEDAVVGKAEIPATKLSYQDKAEGYHVVVFVFSNEAGEPFQMELRYTEGGEDYLLPRMRLMRQMFQFYPQ